MTDKKTALLKVESWHSKIEFRNLKSDILAVLLEELAEDIFSCGVPFDIAREAMLLAGKKSYPLTFVVKRIYDTSPKKKYMTLIEFTKQWHDDIDTQAMRAFYMYYDIDTPVKV